MIKVEIDDMLVNNKPSDVKSRKKHLIKLWHIYDHAVSVSTSNNCLGKVVLWWCHNDRVCLWRMFV